MSGKKIAKFIWCVNMNRDYAIMVPQVDPVTGLTKSGIKSAEAQAPTGTSLEFNYMANPAIVDIANLQGAFIPFHKTEAERIAAGDTRPSLESLYGNQEGYVTAITNAANTLVSQRFLLQRDANLIIQYATDNPILP
jgi:hypothetical protein